MQISSANFGYAYQAHIQSQATQYKHNNSADLQLSKSNALEASAVTSGEQVTISAQAQRMLANESNKGVTPEILPESPMLDHEKYLELKKTQAQYTVASDLISIATGNSDGVSAATAYTLANNDEIRAASVDLAAANNQAELFELYLDTSQQDTGY